MKWSSLLTLPSWQRFAKDQPQVAAALGADGDVASSDGGVTILESCHSTWLFDARSHRFCRVIKGAHFDSEIATEWRDYDRLIYQDDSDAFIVFLDERGTRVLRAWQHSLDCKHCGSEATTEMSLAEIGRTIAV